MNSAADGNAGLNLLRAVAPDVAFVDVGLPGIDGYELARRMRGFPGGENIFLVAFTGYGGSEDKQRAHEAGFDLHVTKPLDLDTLPRVLQQARRPR